MKPRFAVTILLCAALVSSAFPAKSQSPKGAPADVMLTRADSGRTITLRVNQRFIIKVEEGVGTAYSWWALMQPDSPVRFAEQQPAPPARKPDPGAPAMLGGKSDRWIAFRAAKEFPGAFPVTLLYCPLACNEKDSASEIFSVRVTVTN